jgi:hypothetical protein
VTVREASAEGPGELRTENVPLVVEAGRPEVVRDIVLEPRDLSQRATVTGQIIDAETGEGLDGWLVTASKSGLARSVVAMSKEGSFTLELPEDGTYDVRGRATGAGSSGDWSPAGPVPVQVAGGELLSDAPLLVADRRVGLTVVVIGPGGVPVEGAACSLVRQPDNATAGGLRLTRSPSFTDGRGRAEVNADEPGRYDLMVAAAGRALSFLPDVSVPTGEVSVLLPPTGSLEVWGAEELQLVEPITGHAWRLRVSANANLFGLAEVGEGFVRIFGLPPGRWGVRVGEQAGTVEILEGTTATYEP